VYYGSATGALSDNHYAYHTNWLYTDGINDQLYVSHNACGLNSHARASAPGVTTRFHTRMRKTYDTDTTWGTTTQSTPHYELAVACGHAVTSDGFNLARNQSISALGQSGHHPYQWQYWQDTQQMYQCNGVAAASSGYVGFQSIPSWSH
jgi:hypothetical protein